MNQHITPLKIVKIEQLSDDEKDKMGVLDYIPAQEAFFEPWGEEKFWEDFCNAFPQLTETVNTRKNLFSVGYLQADTNNVGYIMRKIIPDEQNKMCAALYLKKDFNQLPLDIKKKIAFHEVLHFMRLSGCKIEKENLPTTFYTKIGHIVEKYDASGQKIDGFGEGLEEACVESMALNSCTIYNTNHEYVSSSHPYASLTYFINTLNDLGFLPFFEQIANTPVEECIHFCDSMFDCLYNEPTDILFYNYNALCEAFDTLYFQTVYGTLRGVPLEHILSHGYNCIENMELAVRNFAVNIDKKTLWLNNDANYIEYNKSSKK